MRYMIDLTVGSIVTLCLIITTPLKMISQIVIFFLHKNIYIKKTLQPPEAADFCHGGCNY